MDAIHKKILKLQEQQALLKQTIAQLEVKHSEELAQMIRRLPPQNLDPITLLGGLLYVCHEAQISPTTAEVWRQAGQKFLKTKHTRSKMDSSIHQAQVKSSATTSSTAAFSTF